MSDEPPKALVAAYEGGSDRDLIVPLSVLREAERTLDEARKRRKVEAEKAVAVKAVNKRGWRHWLRAKFWRRR